jgi:hypothetical protein
MSEISPTWRSTPIEEMILRFRLSIHMSPGGWWFERTDGTPAETKEGPGHVCIDENTPDADVEKRLRDWLGYDAVTVVKIMMAEGGVGDIAPKAVHIQIDQPIPKRTDDRDPIRVIEEMFWDQAEQIALALWESLPQGIRTKVPYAMMKREINCFYGVEHIPLDAKLLNWLENQRQTIELSYDEVELWRVEDILNRVWQGDTLREVLMKASAERCDNYTVAATAKPFNPKDFPPDHNPDLWQQVPHHLREGLRAYLMEGRTTGGLLRCILENDLRKTYGCADPSAAACMPDILAYIYNCAPAPSWGSPEKVSEWLSLKQKELEEKNAASA